MSEEELRRRTGEAARRFAAAAQAPAGADARAEPAPGDLYASEESAAFPVQWLVLGADPGRPGRLEVVAADSAPFAGSADIVVPADVPCGPLTLRSRFRVSIEARHLASENRAGNLPEIFVLRVRERSVALASGAYQPTVLEEETDADPEYRDWVEEVLEPARAALAAGGRERSRDREPARAARWPSALAAIFLMASIGLSVWVVELRREVERASAPIVDPPAFEVAVGDPTRGPERIPVPPGARHLVIEVILDPGLPAFEHYRLELRDAAGRERLGAPPQPPPKRGVYRLVLPLARFPAGEYRLTVHGVSREGSVEIDHRRLTLEPVSQKRGA